MNWIFFPRTNEIPKFLVETISILKNMKENRPTQRNNSKNRLDSDSIKNFTDLLKLGFKVEKSKNDKVIIRSCLEIWEKELTLKQMLIIKISNS